MELIMPVYEIPVNQFRNIIIIVLCILLIIAILIFNMRRPKVKEGENYNKIKFQAISVMLACICTIIICIFSIFGNVLYVIDRKNNYIEKEIVEIIDVEFSYLREYEIVDGDGNEYRLTNNNPAFSHPSELRTYVKQNFLGHSCEIEYYRYSKIVKSITVCD